MTPTPLHTIADMADGLPVLAVQGTVKYAGDLEHGIAKTSGKPWTKQFFVLAQNGAEVAATMWDAEDSEMKKGETVLIENTQNKKGQWSGMVKGSYTNKKNELCHTLEIRANQVKIKPVNGGDATCALNGPMRESASNAAPTSNPESAARFGPRGDLTKVEAQDIPATGINEARQHIMQSVNLYNICVDAVENCVKPHIEGMTAELYQAAVGTLFIEASHAGLVQKMPTKPLSVHNGNEKVERQTKKEVLMPYEETF